MSGGGADPVRDLAVGIDDGRLSRSQEVLEEAHLGREVMLGRRMVVEVIARQVGEGCARELHAIEPVLVEPMRRSLERQMADGAAGEIVEAAVQRDRVRRGQ